MWVFQGFHLWEFCGSDLRIQLWGLFYKWSLTKRSFFCTPFHMILKAPGISSLSKCSMEWLFNLLHYLIFVTFVVLKVVFVQHFNWCQSFRKTIGYNNLTSLVGGMWAGCFSKKSRTNITCLQCHSRGMPHTFETVQRAVHFEVHKKDLLNIPKVEIWAAFVISNLHVTIWSL